MTEKIRSLVNKVILSGALAELENVREGETKAGVPYISFNGAIQCGPTPVYTVRFRTFVKSKKTDGTDSKNYAAVKEWVNKAVPITENKENPTYVKALGSITDRPYVGSDGKLKEYTEYSMQFFSDFDEYAAQIDLEGFVHSIKDETKGADSTETTGRQRMRLISRDIFSNTLDITNIVIPCDDGTEDHFNLVEALEEAGYERGCTSTFLIKLAPNKSVSTTSSRGGVGKQRPEGGKPYLEMVLEGTRELVDPESEQALDPKVIKAAMIERQSHLDEIRDAGYQGNKTSATSSTTSTSRTGIGSTTPKKSVAIEDIDNDDFPF